MKKFIDLDVSFFDPDFTFSPYPFLSDLYARDDILGFRSEGMNFVFRFEHARAVLFNPHCAREPLANPKIAEREAVFAQRYPNRARNFQLTYNSGEPDLKLKRLLMNYIGEVADSADFSGTEAVYRKLSHGGRLENYIEDISTIPLRIMLDTSGLPYTEQQLVALYRNGFDFIKALENFVDETPLAAADQAVAAVWTYLENALEQAEPDSPIARFMAQGEAQGVDRERMIVNISAFLIIALSNTAGISSAYLLRNLVNNAPVRHTLRDDPSLLDNDHVIMEFLRRDNHVKALSRQAHESFSLGGQRIEQGESMNIFFPGVNLDPNHWDNPLEIDLNRQFTGENNIIFGGARYVCIGKYLGIAFLKNMARGFVDHLPDSARIEDSEIEVDGDWVSERVITRMPIQLD